MTMTLTPPAIDTDTCPVCGGSGFVGDGDCVTYCDDPDCPYWRTRVKQDGPEVNICRPITPDMTREEVAAWHARYARVIADGWRPGLPYVPRLH